MRNSAGRFLPGSSGNPGGRPKTPEEVKEMLQALTPKAVKALEAALCGNDPRLQVIAAVEILNRTLGRPHQSASVEVSQPSIHEAFLTALKKANETAKSQDRLRAAQQASAVPFQSAQQLIEHGSSEP
ncbi:DUF5681 domain-containing protein [Prosthecomicrobium sp. N25]|uniref:DUF5681 domain-containing protein n=1 Tax=Prosthecomicrobium sp. N25 TaxID=3129254 RepID=UPI0030776604